MRRRKYASLSMGNRAEDGRSKARNKDKEGKNKENFQSSLPDNTGKLRLEHKDPKNCITAEGTKNASGNSSARVPKPPEPHAYKGRKTGDGPNYMGIDCFPKGCNVTVTTLKNSLLNAAIECAKTQSPRNQFEALMSWLGKDGKFATSRIPGFIPYMLACCVPDPLSTPFAVLLSLLDVTAKTFGRSALEHMIPDVQQSLNGQHSSDKVTKSEGAIHLDDLCVLFLSVLTGQPHLVKNFVEITDTLQVESHKILAQLYLCQGWHCETKPSASVKKTPKKRQGEDDTGKHPAKRKKLEGAFAAEDSASRQDPLASAQRTPKKRQREDDTDNRKPKNEKSEGALAVQGSIEVKNNEVCCNQTGWVYDPETSEEDVQFVVEQLAALSKG